MNKIKKKRKRSRGKPSFITELPLKLTIAEKRNLEKRFEAGDDVFNAVLGESFKRREIMLNLPEYIAARNEKDKEKRKKLFATAAQESGFREYDLHNYGKQFNHCWINQHLESTMVQKIATRAFRAVADYHFKKKGKPRFKSPKDFNSLEGKNNINGLTWCMDHVEWKTQKGIIHLQPIINSKDEVIEHGLKSKVKYIRIVRRAGRKLDTKDYDYFVQLVSNGVPLHKKKHKQAKGKFALDIGPSTVAGVGKDFAFLVQFCSELITKRKELRILDRQIDRQRRANNSVNYNANGTIKCHRYNNFDGTFKCPAYNDEKGKPLNLINYNADGSVKKWKEGNKLEWVKSNRQLKTEHKRAKLYKKMAAQRKTAHGRLINLILSHGDDIWIEKLSYVAFQKMWGRSVRDRAPGMFVELLRQKLKSRGGELHEFSTYSTKLSQSCQCGRIKKKELSERWHECECGVIMQRDLYSAFLALFIEDDKLNAREAQKAFPGLEAVLKAALRDTQAASGQRIVKNFPASFGFKPETELFALKANVKAIEAAVVG